MFYSMRFYFGTAVLFLGVPIPSVYTYNISQLEISFGSK